MLLGFPISYESKDVVAIAGSFDATGSAVAAQRGSGFVAARSTTGTYTVTFTDAYPDYIAFVATGEDSANDDKLVQVKSFASQVLTLFVVNGAGAAADGNSTTRVNFIAFFRKSTV